MKELNNIIACGENSKVEFKAVSVSPKVLAEEIVAFLNVRGGIIYIGVEDDGTISGIDINRKASLEETIVNVCRNNILPPIIPDIEIVKCGDKWIAKLIIAEGLSKPYQTIGGNLFIRAGSSKRVSSREELLRLFQNSLVIHIDNHPVPGTSLNNLVLDRLKQFFDASILTPVDNKINSTLAGLLFFAQSDPTFPVMEKFLPQAGIQFVSYDSEDMTHILDRYTCYEASPQAIDSVIHKIRLNWKTPSTIKGLLRIERSFPMKIFRELIVNAIVHRDYSIQSLIFIRMYPHKVEIQSPGNLVNTVTIEKMKAGISVPRNPLIIKFMQNFRYADQLGRGIPMILKTLENFPDLNLILQASDDYFICVLEIQTSIDF
jgi:ATP-dependent DNA helicase RecG